MDNRPIGVFDSGFGGLTAVKALRELLPEENIVYFGDSGRAPYGQRPVSQLRQMARQDLELLLSMDVKAVLAACGTVSSNAADLLAACPVPVVGVLRPAVREMCRLPGQEALAVLATPASIASAAFQRGIEEGCPGRELLAIACPDFVTLIESGHHRTEDPLVKEAVARYLAPVKEAGVRRLLLGCTHFGLIGEAIRAYLGEAELVSASHCAAQETRQELTARQCLGCGGQERYFTSGEADAFRRAAAVFLGGERELSVSALPVMEV